MLSVDSFTKGVKRLRDHPKKPWGRKTDTAIHETELHSLQRTETFDPPPEYRSVIDVEMDLPPPIAAGALTLVPESVHEESIHEEVEETDVGPKTGWVASSLRRKIILLVIFVFCTFRAVVAIIVNAEGLFNNHTTPSAPSVLLLALVSIQISLSNLTLPRPIRAVLTLDVLLVAAAFGIASYAPHSEGNYPSYGELALNGGTCPIPASSCLQQMSHWDEVGCGNYTVYNPDGDDAADDLIPTSSYYAPTATQTNVNTGMNPLHIVEAVIFVFGTIWLLSSAFQVYEIRYIFWPRKDEELLPFPTAKPKRRNCGIMLTGCVPFFGIMGAFVASCMSIGAHMSQSLGSHHTTYIDSFGPVASANITENLDYVVTSVTWNTTSWSDCFVLSAPTSPNGISERVGGAE
jgi:hypothetical protein